MIQLAQNYLDANYYYDFMSGPASLKLKKVADRVGINCVALFHLMIRDLFGYSLPNKLRSYEMTHDTQYFEEVSTLSAMQLGDIVGFGSAKPQFQINTFKPKFIGGELINWQDFPVKHFAVYINEKLPGDYLMLHASPVDGTVSVWPLKKFSRYKNYQKIYYIKRLKAQFHNLQ